MTKVTWQTAESKADTLPRIPIRGIRGLPGSNHPAFPESIPHIGNNLFRVRPESTDHSLDVLADSAGELMRREIDAHPAILFKDVPITSQEEFGIFCAGMGLNPHDYTGGNAVRDKQENNVNVASFEPPEVTLSPHNEMAYMPGGPTYIMFYCHRAAEVGGEVPMNDNRRTPDELDTAIVRETRERDIRYYRWYPEENTSQVVGWKQSLGVGNKAEAEAYLARHGINYDWGPNGSMTTWHQASVFQTYKGKEVWLNQMSEMHSSFWTDNDVYWDYGLKEDEIQGNSTFGDGEPIPMETILQIRGAIWRTTEVLKMEPGDLVLLDNNLFQHGRMHYSGTRKHYVYLAT